MLLTTGRFFLLLIICVFVVQGHVVYGNGSRHSDSTLYRKHIRYVYKEHRKLTKRLTTLCKTTSGDSITLQRCYALTKTYHQSTQGFSYVKDKKSKAALSDQYRESQTHRGIIEKTYQTLKQESRAGSMRLKAQGKLKEAASLQKQAFYSSGKYQYFKKNQAAKLLDQVNAKNIDALKQSQQFITTVKNPAASLKGAAPVPQLPNVQLPENLQTNAEVNKVFASQKSGTGVTKQQKFQNAISNPLQSMIDTTRSLDSLLFKPNPYRVMPLADRIKMGGNSTMGDLLTGGRRMSYALQLQYLWMPEIKPVLAIAYEHALINRSGRWSAPAINWQLRIGAEMKGYKMIHVFANYERSYRVNNNLNEKSAGQHEFVLGLTNDTGKRHLLKLWAGIRLRELAMRYASPFVFRVGF